MEIQCTKPPKPRFKHIDKKKKKLPSQTAAEISKKVSAALFLNSNLTKNTY